MCGVIPTECVTEGCSFYVIIGPCPKCGGKNHA